VQWLAAHPKETLIISIKNEQNEAKDFDSESALDIRSLVYTILTDVHRPHMSPTGFQGMWHNHNVSCILGQARGKVILWRRFAGEDNSEDASTPGVDLVDLSLSYDNTKKALPGNFLVQDYYQGSLKERRRRG
jgi:hypothetical protein